MATRRILAKLTGYLSLLGMLIFFVAGQAAALEPDNGKVESVSQYKLSAGDALEVFVWREEELSRPVTINPDGHISYPLAGEIRAAGLTLSELQAKLTTRIRGYIPKALVTVSLVEVSGYRVYVLGEVDTSGEYVPGNYVTIAQALSLAGGLTEFASESNIKVVRQRGGSEQFIEFNYSRFKSGKDISSNIRLESGDVVLVP